MSGLKTGMENGMFWSEVGSGFGEPGSTPPPQIPTGTPPPPLPGERAELQGWRWITVRQFCEFLDRRSRKQSLHSGEIFNFQSLFWWYIRGQINADFGRA